MNPQIPQGLDPTAFILTKAIKRSESSGSANPYTVSGDSGTSTGAYQIQDSNWGPWAQQYLGDANAPKTEENQNKLAYSRVKDLLSQGHTQSQVASIWNSGNPDPNAVGKGHNDKLNVDYDVPGYVNKVKQNYSTIQTELQRGFNPTPYSTPDQGQAPVNTPNTPQDTGTQEKSLGQELSGRLSDAGQALSDASTGKINPLSGVLQAAGAGAGAIGDVVNKGLELIPGVKWLEGELGQGIGALAQTPVGKSVVSSMQQFSKDHPELSADIGAGFNIATAIPILKGLGVVKDIAMSGLGSALEGIASKGISKEILGTAARTVAGRDAVSGLGDNLENVVKEGIVKPRAIPDIVDGKYDVTEALAKTDALRGDIATKELQPVLDKLGDTPQGHVPLEGLRQEALAQAKGQLHDTGAVNKMFDRIQTVYGDNPTLADLNKAKQLVSQQVPQKAFDLEGYNANYNVRQTLQHGIERAGILQGLPDIGAINGKIRLLYQADDLLRSMSGKPVKVGLFSKLARKGVSVGAGMLANQMGGGVIGGLGAGYMTDIADKGLQGVGGSFRRAILNRTTSGALKNAVKSSATKLPGLFGGAVAQKLNKSQK
jgi:hypothetical protein